MISTADFDEKIMMNSELARIWKAAVVTGF
jgi:hypothetical protein